MDEKGPTPLAGIVEVDETYLGGEIRANERRCRGANSFFRDTLPKMAASGNVTCATRTVDKEMAESTAFPFLLVLFLLPLRAS